MAMAVFALLAAGAGIWLWTKGKSSSNGPVAANAAVAGPAPAVNVAPAVRTDASTAPPSTAIKFSIPYAKIPSNAVFLLGNTPVQPGKGDGAHHIEIQPADFNKVLNVSAPGYEPYSMNQLAALREPEIKPMTRETGTLLISSIDGRKSDYARLKIVWKSVFPAGTERQSSEVNELIEEIASLEGTSVKEVKLPTGDYELVALGGESEGKWIKPRGLPAAGSITQLRGGQMRVSIPPSYSGKYELREELPGGKGNYRLFELSLPNLSGSGTMRQTDHRANGTMVSEIDFKIFGLELEADGKLQAKVESTKAEPAIKKKVEFRAQFSFSEGKLRCENVPGEIEKNRFRFDLSRAAAGEAEKK